MSDKELVETRDRAWTACKGSDAERDIAGLRAVAEVAWEKGLNTGIGYAGVMHIPYMPEPENPYRNTDTKGNS